MAQKKEDLQKLLVLLENLANENGNEWFREELAIRFGNSQINSIVENKISSIEQYLLIDSKKCIDYSKILDKNVMNQLVKDCIEMNRYRVGTIRHAIEFEQYCLFAHFQAEELLNYFFERRHSNNINFIIDELEYNGQRINDKCSSVSRISYNNKLIAFYKMKFIDYQFYDCFYNVSLLRNKLSHRSSKNKAQDDLIEAKFEAKNFHLNKIDINILSKDDKDLYFAGKIIKLIKSLDWTLVYNSLNELLLSIVINEKTNVYKRPTIFSYNNKK